MCPQGTCYIWLCTGNVIDTHSLILPGNVMHTINLIRPGNDDVEDDEALARRLQEQEDALATRGRATRGALRVKHKLSQPAHKGSSREARHARGSASAAVRSSSRLKPQSGEGKQRPMTRGSAGVHMFNIVQER